MTRSEPYHDNLEHLFAELERIDLLLQLHLEAWWAHNGETVDEFRGLYVSDEEVERLVQSSPGRGGQTVGVRSQEDLLLEELETRSREVRHRKRLTEEADIELRLVALAERFDLEHRHLEAILVGMAPELDEKYEKIFSYLQDDVTKKQPTVGLILRLLCEADKERLETRTLFSRRSPLRRHRLVRLSEGHGTPSLSRFVTVDERIVDYLLGEDDIDVHLEEIAEITHPDRSIDGVPVEQAVRDRLHRIAAKVDDEEITTPIIAYFYGPNGSGVKAAVDALCSESDRPLVRAEASELFEDQSGELVDLLLREAQLQDAILFLENIDGVEEETGVEPADIVAALDEFGGPVIVSSETDLTSTLHGRAENHDLVPVNLPLPSYELRTELWERTDGLPDDVEATELAAKFRLTPGQIEDAVSTAEVLANGNGITEETLLEGCRAQSTETLDSLAQKIEPNYGWDDIVLPPDRMAHLREVAAQINHQGTVYSEWGFEEKYSLGNGLVVLFSGPSGTGKTMAAEILANDAGLDLYKVDLASVVSKYIGETEKNLRKIFDEAAGTNAILFFDEADALFGKRSEVNDARDRYANIEVNYLLQRIEEHDGTVILTSNFKENIDDAFQRRIHHSINFPRPDEEARERIWRGVFPDETPVGEVEFPVLATLTMTGGSIKNAALTAAFLAADNGGVVEMEHVIKAMRREFEKNGEVLDPQLF